MIRSGRKPCTPPDKNAREADLPGSPGAGFRASPGRRIFHARIVEHQYPIVPLAASRGREGHRRTGIPAAEFPDPQRAPAADIVPPGHDPLPGNPSQVDGKRPSALGIDHGIGAEAVAGSRTTPVPPASIPGDNALIGNTAEKRTALDKFPPIAHLISPGQRQGFAPAPHGPRDRRIPAGFPHLPYGMAAVGMSAGPGKDLVVERPPHMQGFGSAVFSRSKSIGCSS